MSTGNMSRLLIHVSFALCQLATATPSRGLPEPVEGVAIELLLLLHAAQTATAEASDCEDKV